MLNDGIRSEKNCITKIVPLESGEPRVCIFALKEIQPGEELAELRYDYGVPNLPWRTVSLQISSRLTSVYLTLNFAYLFPLFTCQNNLHSAFAGAIFLH